MTAASRLRGLPLAAWERDGLKAALHGAGLPVDDAEEPRVQFWRYETLSDVPVGFGGLEIHDRDALLRSVVTLPPLRHTGMGRSIVAALEAEAAAHSCDAIYLLAAEQASFFERLGYAPCVRERVPAAIRASKVFTAQREAATPMLKRL
jgi:N-acetylglutamate synthase-like GNAT family acetyltransferase